MHKAPLPSWFIRHRKLFYTAAIAAVVWGVVLYLMYRFPYAIDILGLDIFPSNMTALALNISLVGMVLLTAGFVVGAINSDYIRMKQIVAIQRQLDN